MIRQYIPVQVWDKRKLGGAEVKGVQSAARLLSVELGGKDL